MHNKIIVLRTFKKEFKHLSKRYHSLLDDVINLQKEILLNPNVGTDIGGGLRKIRMRITSKGKGKSGGARVLTFNVVVAIDKTEINLLYIYDKAERSNIQQKEIDALLRENGLK